MRASHLQPRQRRLAVRTVMPVTATVAQVMATAVIVAAAHTVTRVTVVLTTVLTVTPVTIGHTMGLTVTPVIVVLTMGVTDTPCTTAHITGLMDTHHSFRGIGFIDRFTLTQVTCPAIAPLVTQRTGVDVRCAPHALWLDS